MFGIGFQEILVILLIALLVVGPRRLPQIARAIGRALGEIRKAAEDFRETIEAEELRASLEEERKKLEEEFKKEPETPANTQDNSGDSENE